MKISTFIIIYYLITSCHNKQDLQKINLLESQNIILNDSLKKQNRIVQLVYDSLVEVHANEFTICGVVFEKKIIINNPNSRKIKHNDFYEANESYVKTQDVLSNAFLYNEPTPNRIFIDSFKFSAPISNSLGNGSNAFLNLNPKIYWNGIWQTRNDRTGKLTSLSIVDSFYVYP